MLRTSLTPALQEASGALHAHSVELAWDLLVKGVLARAELAGPSSSRANAGLATLCDA